MDKIFIDDLCVFGRHGVLSEENTLGQMFHISAEITLDLSAAGKSDALEDTVDYSALCHALTRLCAENTYKLIETLAENAAYTLLNADKRIRNAKVRIDKPSAPIGLPFKSVGVEVERSRHTAYIALGSNMGDKQKNLEYAVDALNSDSRCSVTAVSPFIITAPVSDIPQDDYLNGCLALDTLCTPEELLDLLNAIEKNAGRVRLEKWGPRTLDLDIIFYDDVIMQTEKLTIPHKLMHTRTFVLEPLNTIAPFARHPVFGKTVSEMLDALGF